MFGLRVAILLPAFTLPFYRWIKLPDWPLSHGDLSPDTAAQLWPVRTAFPGSTGERTVTSLNLGHPPVNRAVWLG